MATGTFPIDTEKWETGIDATATDIREVKAFVDWRLSVYKENRWKGFDLWESFVDDFESFTKGILDGLGKDRLKTIREYLRENGVYVRKEARKSIAEGLLGAIHEQTPSKWPADDPAPSLSSPSTASVQTVQPSNTPSTQTIPAQINQPTTKTVHDGPAQITQAIDQLALQGSFGREIANLTKFYTDEVKYSGEQDNFDFKFEIFQNYCLRAGVPKQAYIIAVPTMLRGPALKYYFTHLKDLNLLENVCAGLKSYFEGDEYKRDILSKWNAITLKQVATQEGLDTGQAFQKLIDEMWQLQRGLAKDLQNDTTFYNKLLTACQDVSACKPACFRPATTLAGLISDIKSSIATYGKQEIGQFYTDRRYHPSNRNKDSNKGKKCFVCGKSGCWSTNHTKDEKDRRIRQYISDFEGGNEDDDDNQGDAFITEFGPVNGRKAFDQLANNATLHALTGSIEGKESQEASNFYFDVEPCSDYHDDPEAEAFWTEFAREKG
jgi:hypothetical protein